MSSGKHMKHHVWITKSNYGFKIQKKKTKATKSNNWMTEDSEGVTERPGGNRQLSGGNRGGKEVGSLGILGSQPCKTLDPLLG